MSRAAFALTLLALAQCGSDEPFAPSEPGLFIVGGLATADTIGTALDRPLVVSVIDDLGVPCAGCIVRFDPVAAPEPDPPYFKTFYVALNGSTTRALGLYAVDTTDAQGRASVTVAYGPFAGSGEVAITVPEFGYVDTARFDILPGSLAQVRVDPTDTAVYAGRTIRLRGVGLDRFGNRRSDPVAFSVVSGPATVDAGGLATVSTIGRVRIAANVGVFSDTAFISVVPRAQLASQRYRSGNAGLIGVFRLEADGTILGAAGRPADDLPSIQGWEWMPDGSGLVRARWSSITFVPSSGVEQPILDMNGLLLATARVSRDGQWIYFTQQARGQPHTGMYRVRRDGTDLQPLGQSEPNFGLSRHPAPSHDGHSIVYVSDRCGDDDCVQVLDLATNQDRTFGARSYLVRGSMVAWSPIEDLIAYAHGNRIAVIRPDGSGDRVLADDIALVTWMDWSPDGRWLIVDGQGPMVMFEVATGLRLPIAQLHDFAATAWRP